MAGGNSMTLAYPILEPYKEPIADRSLADVRLDPALQKYYDANKYRYRNFRWTPRTAWISFCYMALVPGLLGYAAYKTEGKWEFRGKRRGDTIAEY